MLHMSHIELLSAHVIGKRVISKQKEVTVLM
jgi:hypothetical protein